MTVRRTLPPPQLAVAALAMACLFGGQVARGQSNEPVAAADPIKADLDRSKDAFQAKIDTIKKDVAAALDAKIAAGRKKKGNTEIVEQLTAEKSAFEENVNRIPPSLGKTRAMIAKRIKNARNDLANAYKRAIRAATGVGNDAQANGLKSELEKLIATAAPLVAYERAPEQPPADAAATAPALKLDPKILVDSRWNFIIRRFGVLNQPGAFKIANGVIYHLDARNPVGEASIDAMGQIHLSFVGHRKITVGEAVVRKVANGKFQGVLNLAGDEWGFEMNRR
ncbi:MAG: hypothetical protein ACLQIB_08190 [Isosphaeraceae bacterium]